MKNLHYSKTITNGCAVQLRGNKICRASKRTKHPLGVFQAEAQRIFLTIENGEFKHAHTTTPAGVQTKGPCVISLETT